MNLRYEQLRKKQEEMIKDMERSVFKRETIQLKYLPKVEKKNAQDKSSQGKLSRQIANIIELVSNEIVGSVFVVGLCVVARVALVGAASIARYPSLFVMEARVAEELGEG